MTDKNDSTANASGALDKVMVKARKIAARGVAKNWQEVIAALGEPDKKRFHAAATPLEKDELTRVCNSAHSLVRQVAKNAEF